MCSAQADVRFSNRPFWVKRFQTIHGYGVDVAHGLALLFGIGTRALPLWDSRTRRNDLSDGLAARVTVGPSGHANSPHPSSREGHHSTVGWSSSVLLSHVVRCVSHATAASRVHWNSVPCPLSEVKRTSLPHRKMSAFDPKRTSHFALRISALGVKQNIPQRFMSAFHRIIPYRSWTQFDVILP